MLFLLSFILLLCARYFSFPHIQIVTQALTSAFLTYLNLKFKCTTVKSSFAAEDDMRMSKHVLYIKKVRFFIERSPLYYSHRLFKR